MADENFEFIRTEIRDRIFCVTINRPEVMNALHPPANAEMEAAWNRFHGDDGLWVAIVTGAGDRAFCAGNDLKYQAEGNAVAFPETGFGGLTHRWDLVKPVIAAVNGVAMGGGLEIALAADIILSAERAKFALPEPKVGLAAIAGGIHRLPRQIGLKNAMGMMLTGRAIDAAEAYRIGLAQEVCADAELLDRAYDWAAQIAACAPISVRATKQSAMNGLGRPLEEAIKTPSSELHRMLKSEDFIEGPTAFAEKRAPRWKGK